MKRKDYTPRLERQLVKMEEMVEALLDGIKISEMTAGERLFMVTRVWAVYQRGLAFGHTFEMDEPGNRENAMAAAFRRFVRGGTDVFSDQVEVAGVVDAKLEGTEITWHDPELDMDDIESD